MIDKNWIIALAAVGVGLVVGAVAGAVVRRTLSRESRREAVREIAAPSSIFVFWLATSTGVVAAMAATNPETLEPIPSEILRWLPNVLAAGLILLAGYAVSVVVSGSLGRGFTRATGRRSRLAERTLRAAIVVGATILALGQLGVETTILIVLTAGTVAAVALAAGLLAGLGGRDVAASIAAGRVLRSEITEGLHVIIDGEPMQVMRLGAASASGLSGTRNSRPTLVRSPGIVQMSPSISCQHIPRTSPERVAVRASILMASFVVGKAPELSMAASAAGTSSGCFTTPTSCSPPATASASPKPPPERG